MVIRRKRNKVHGFLLPNGVWCNNDTILKKQHSLFKGIFFPTSPILSTSMGDSTMDLILIEEAKHSLTLQVMREKVTYALNQMYPFKAPDPDGFFK